MFARLLSEIFRSERCKSLDSRGAKVCRSCRSRQKLSHEYLVFTCKNRLRYIRERASQSLGAIKVWGRFNLFIHSPPRFRCSSSGGQLCFYNHAYGSAAAQPGLCELSALATPFEQPAFKPAGRSSRPVAAAAEPVVNFGAPQVMVAPARRQRKVLKDTIE